MPTILVTGANRGLGLEFARQYAVHGWDVLACCRAPEKAAALREVLRTSRGSRVLSLDVAQPEQFQPLAESLKENAIDILLHNAGLRGPVGGSDKVDPAEWLDVLKVNTIAPLKLSQALLENVARSGRKLIVTVTSKMGSIALSEGGSPAYRSSKAAVNAVMKSLAEELKSRGITVLVVHPGWVRTDMGAPQAPLRPVESVAAVRHLLENAKLADSGKFYNYDGSELPW